METDDQTPKTIVNITGDSNVTNFGAVHGKQSSNTSDKTKTSYKKQSSLKKILIGISIIVIAGLILYYIFGIKS
jgi:hypothetical protein